MLIKIIYKYLDNRPIDIYLDNIDNIEHSMALIEENIYIENSRSKINSLSLSWQAVAFTRELPPYEGTTPQQATACHNMCKGDAPS